MKVLVRHMCFEIDETLYFITPADPKEYFMEWAQESKIVVRFTPVAVQLTEKWRNLHFIESH